MNTELKILKKELSETFGFKDFKKSQKEPIVNVYNKKNTLVVLPTGEGKSIIYQVPALTFKGLTIVISPLISLMKDQVTSLKSKGIEAEFYNSSLDNFEKMEIWNKLENNELKLLYISPERIFIDNFLDKILEKCEISLFVIDEIHCVSSWGSDFRTDYLKLDILLSKYKEIPIVGTTATIDQKTLLDIKNFFKFKEENIFYSSPLKDNIEYIVEKKVSDGYEQIYNTIKKHRGKPGIVYCYSKKEVGKLSGFLKRKKIKAQSYHADLKQTSKDRTYKRFLNNSVQVVVATVAFGMGIDKEDIRFIIHKEPSYSLENYVQETGRAGRDNKKAKAYLFYSKKDINILKWIVKSDEMDSYKFLFMKSFRETNDCKKEFINKYFTDESKKIFCGNCTSCKQEENKFVDENMLKQIYDKSQLHFLDTLVTTLSKEFKVDKYEMNNYIFQLYIKGSLDINQDLSILIKEEFNEFKFNKFIENNTDFILKKKPSKRKTSTAKKTTTSKRKTSTAKKTTTSKRKPSTAKKTTTSKRKTSTAKKSTTSKRKPSTAKKSTSKK